MSIKRIIEVLPLLSGKSADGPSYSVVRLCETLINRGMVVDLINCDCTEVLNPPIFLKRYLLGIGPRKLCRSPSMYKSLIEAASNNEISLLHSHGLWTMPNIYPGWIAKKFNIPMIISPRGSLAPWSMRSGSYAKKIFWPIHQKPSLKRAACLHATAESEYLDMRRLGFTQPVAIIPNGIDLPPTVPQKTASKMRTLLFLGRINPIKGLDILLPAWAKVQDKFPDWQLHIAGPDSRGYLETVKKMAIDLKLERIEFPGLLTGNTKWQAYQDAELYILPSYTENFGMTIAEALASGTPAIVSKGAPWGGLVTNNAGWWVEINVEKLVESLETALTCSTSELAEMGQRGKTWMKEDFSWESIGQKMETTYKWVINGGPTPAWIRTD